MKKQRKEPLYLIFSLLGGVVLLFIAAPLLNMLFHTTPTQLAETVADEEVYKSIWLTLITSMVATLLCAVCAIPFAWLLARKKIPLRHIVNGIIDLPIVIPHSAAGIALLGVLSRNSLLGQAAEKMGFSFVGGHAGIMVAMAFVSIPFLINAARDGYESVPEHLEKAALNLGASTLRVFLTISTPLAWRSIVSGLVLMWARGMSEFGAVLVITYHPMITPVLIFERFGAFGLKYARPVSVIFIAICLTSFILFRIISQGGKKC